MNCKNTDWALVSYLIPQDENNYQPDKPNKKDYSINESEIYMRDMIRYFEEWNENIADYYKIIDKFFIGVWAEHREWNNTNKEENQKLRERIRKYNNNYQSWERKLWYFRRG